MHKSTLAQDNNSSSANIGKRMVEIAKLMNSELLLVCLLWPMTRLRTYALAYVPPGMSPNNRALMVNGNQWSVSHIVCKLVCDGPLPALSQLVESLLDTFATVQWPLTHARWHRRRRRWAQRSWSKMCPPVGILHSTCCDVCLTFAKLSTRCIAIVMSASERMRCLTYQPCNGALLRIWWRFCTRLR